jgi:hypothetical protein
MGAKHYLGVGLLVLIGTSVADCSFANPSQVNAIASAVDKMDLKSFGGAVCDKVLEVHAVGATTPYYRTVAVHGADRVPEIVSRLEDNGFVLDAFATRDDPVNTYLFGPDHTSATVLAQKHETAGQTIALNDSQSCPVPVGGITLVTFKPSGG